MKHPKDNELYPIGQLCKWKTHENKVVQIVGYNFQYQGRGFLNYKVREVAGREGEFAAYHPDLETL